MKSLTCSTLKDGYPFNYSYDEAGNIKAYELSCVQTKYSLPKVTYTYDAQGQLKTATNGTTSYSYTYDGFGNLKTANGHTYTYGNASWRDLLTAYDGESITYDGSGNPTSYYNGTRWNFTWAEGRNLVDARGGGHTVSYTYDHNGVRTSKTVDGVLHTYTYASGKLLREVYGTTVLDFFYDASGTPVSMRQSYTNSNNYTVYYYITNLQGDVIRLVDLNGNTAASYNYDPYGNVIEASGSHANINPLRYRGYYYDSDTELYYLQSRYYDPQICRFINADGAVSTGQGLLGNNMFAYCGNNPVLYTDSQGNSATLAGAICGGFFGFLGAVISELQDDEEGGEEGIRWDKVIECTLSGAATGAASGFVADVSIATFGVVPAMGIAAAVGGVFSGLNSAYVQNTLSGEIDPAKVASDVFLGAVSNGLCTGTSAVFEPTAKGIWDGVRMTWNQIDAELIPGLLNTGSFIVNDFLPTAITGFFAWLGGFEYDAIAK